MNLRKTLLLCLPLLFIGTVSAQVNTTTKQDTTKKNLPADAIIVKRVPLESGPEFNSTDALVVDTIPSSSEGLSIVLYNDDS